MENRIDLRKGYTTKESDRTRALQLPSILRSALFVVCFFGLALSISCIFQSSSYAFDKSDKNTKAEPTVITSESLTTDNKAKTALFAGSVVAKKGDMMLYADRMLVYYMEGSGGNSNIDKIDAEGNVKLVRGNRVITSGKLVYYAGADERAVFTEGPRAAEGRNVVTGTKMTYYLKDDRSVVQNSKVFIVEKEQGSHGKKITDQNQNKMNK